MDIFLQQLINSLSVASVTILIGMGITLIFGLAGIVNFAHGEFLMVGGMVTWLLVMAGVNFFIAMFGAMAAVGVLGYVAERTLFRFTLNRPMNGFIMSIGLSVILQNVVIKALNEVQKSIPDPIAKVWVIGGVDIIAMRAIVVAITVVVVAITYFGITRSRYGVALRASVSDQDTAALMGIPVRRYVTGVFIYGSVLAGLGGALMIALFPITPFTGSVVIIRGFAVSLIGGLGNVGGAVVGGLVLGLVDALSAQYGYPQWTDAYSLVVMIVILILRPQGLLGGTLGPRAT
ncbi:MULTISPECIES: branched-chain amino acid ABC transporter permease [unclassified Acidisoma]|jgi:branched-chain amino acid transport system permease protein|uniref:branched-chain amino acid ABC transporter permease n=1 Tax=unclassified Acidisoma TaxID=2634065 RepID=UPI00131E2091|nr:MULTISPECIES: branched-chain amino acid ABC transporter permease [unclassified Acidisoma]